MTNNDKVEVLKPCPVPWCGEAEQLSFIVSHWTGAACVECLTCCARGPFVETKEAAITAWNTRTPDEIVESLWSAIQHGDEEHRVWLKEAIVAHFAGRAVPPPRGSGRKEVLIAEIVEALEKARNFFVGEPFQAEARECLAVLDAALTKARGHD